MKQNMNKRYITWSKVGLCILMLSWGAFASDNFDDEAKEVIMKKRLEQSSNVVHNVRVVKYKQQPKKESK